LCALNGLLGDLAVDVFELKIREKAGSCVPLCLKFLLQWVGCVFWCMVSKDELSSVTGEDSGKNSLLHNQKIRKEERTIN